MQSSQAAAARINQTGMIVFLGAVSMMFLASLSALVVRRGLSGDWGAGIPMPPALWASTSIIVLSSVALRVGRRPQSFAALLGAAFLGTQAWAWADLLNAGVTISSSPGASFFFLLTAAHGLHVAGGVIALLRCGAAARTYWHFMAGLWIILLALFHLVSA
jgi:cytochrome c oxidase subunit III